MPLHDALCTSGFFFLSDWYRIKKQYKHELQRICLFDNGVIEQVHNGVIEQVHNGVIERVHNGVIEQVHNGVIEQVHRVFQGNLFRNE